MHLARITFLAFLFTMGLWKENISSSTGDHTGKPNDFAHRDFPFSARVFVQDEKFH